MGQAYSAPKPTSWILGALLLREEEGRRGRGPTSNKGGWGGREGEVREGKGEERRKGREGTPKG